MRFSTSLIIIIITIVKYIAVEKAEVDQLQILSDDETQIKQYITANSLLTVIKQRKSPKSKPYRCNSISSYLILILLANANDVNPIPGPTQQNNSTLYPCGTCDQPVTWDHRAVRCDTCDQWFHINCQDIHSGTYSYLTADENTALRWDCIVCDSPNYNSLCYGSTSIQTENSFSPLENTLNNSTETQNRKPLHSSTPKRNNVKEKHKPFTPLRILNVNCQSIRNKQHQVENIIDSTKPDVIIATETWLDQSITNSQIFPQEYNIYRKDRKGNKTGGGVLIAINNKYLSSEVPELDTDYLDKLALWEEKWKMEFHPEKCSVLTVSRKKKPIKWDYVIMY
ncbi:unnamed protein product [Mytilus coruscus]|uniref:PHD-type domain-containing protein n=1 Tax=Mytilus coruscus TaxID=42192 RepID=A0A6J8DMG1_MYTCO|nr:unnamed protein product [Mytilus coruscus]